MPRQPLLGTRFDAALQRASELHRFQLRKGTPVPYLSHLLAVCSLVLQHGGNEDEAIAALLHDAAEDQGGRPTLDSLRTQFGDAVADIVESCSDALDQPKPPALKRKQDHLVHLDRDDTSRSVLLVSAADKVHNLCTIIADYEEMGKEVWDRFKLTPAQQLWYYRSLSRVFTRRLDGSLARSLAQMAERLAVLVAVDEEPQPA